MPDGGQVGADLMGAAGEQLDLEQREAVPLLNTR